jgi:hypothetical protein
VGAQLGEDER